jgi:erythronate-4-phosphate dehydrogenase
MIVRTRTKCNAELLENSKVKFIATATIGFDHIDADYCDKTGITWTNAPGCNSSSVAQYISSVLLNLAVRKDLDLSKMTLGVIGVGNVGSKVAKVGKALGMNVLLNDPPRARAEGNTNFSELEYLLENSDIVTMHVPLNMEGADQTYHLADEKFINRMRPKAHLINSSRGEVVDSGDLKKALKGGKLAGAVLDVWEHEPVIDLELLNLVDIGTPHIAGYSADGKANGTAMSVKALCEYFNLPLGNWYPQEVPKPENTVIELSNEASETESLLKAVCSAYNVISDDQRLRASTESFEKQRGNYPLRREPPIFTVKGATPKVTEALKALGFEIA